MQKTVLNNGVRVITEEIPSFNSASLGVWVNVGSRHETESNAGITHVVEHMLFKGTGTRSARDIAELMEGVGGHMNGTTDKEQTCFSARVMDQHVPMALDLLCDMMLNSVFDQEEMDREKGVILDELKTYEDSPADVIQDIFMRTLWDGHPLGRPVIGHEDVIRGMSRQTILSYLEQHYFPENILVTAAGRVDHDAVVRQTDSFWGQLKRGAAPPASPAPQTRLGNIIKVKDVEQVYVCLGGPGLSMRDRRKYALQVLDAILGGGMAPRLFQEVREKRGLVYNVGTFMMSFMDAGVFGSYVVTAPDNLAEVLRLIRDINDEVRRNGITEKELVRAREYLKGSFSLGLESTSLRMTRLMRTELCEGRWISPEEAIGRYSSVTLEEVNAMAAELLDADRFASVVMGPVTPEHTRAIEDIIPGTWQQEQENLVAAAS